MRLVVQTNFMTERNNRPGVGRNAVVRPRCVVEMLHLSDVVIEADLERADYKVRRLFAVGQGDSELGVLFLFTLDFRPVQLTLHLNTSSKSPYSN